MTHRNVSNERSTSHETLRRDPSSDRSATLSYSRREILKRSQTAVVAVSLAGGLPLALGSVARRALGQSGGGATDASTLLLKIALLEQAFYTRATQPVSLTALAFTSDESAAVTEIRMGAGRYFRTLAVIATRSSARAVLSART